MREVFLSQYGRVGRSEVVAEFGPLRGPRRRDRGDGVPADASPGRDAIDVVARPSRHSAAVRASGPRTAPNRPKIGPETTPELV